MNSKPELVEARSGRPLFTLSIEAQRLIDALRKTSIGEVVSYQRLNDITGDDVQQHRSALATARRRLMSEHIHFGTIRGEGIKRLGVEEAIDSGQHDIKRTQRSATRVKRKLSCIDYKTPEQRQRGAALQTIARIQEAVAKSKSQKILTLKCATDDDKLLSLRSAFEALGNG